MYFLFLYALMWSLDGAWNGLPQFICISIIQVINNSVKGCSLEEIMFVLRDPTVMLIINYI